MACAPFLWVMVIVKYRNICVSYELGSSGAPSAQDDVPACLDFGTDDFSGRGFWATNFSCSSFIHFVHFSVPDISISAALDIRRLCGSLDP